MYRKRNFSRNSDRGGFRTYNTDKPIAPQPVVMGQPEAPSISPWTVKQYGSKLSVAPVTLLLNPGEEALKVAQPYPIINSNNPSIERNYNGKNNENGLIVNDITVNPRSKMINEFDSGMLRIKLAYRYLRMRNSNDTVQPYNAINYQYNQAYNDGRARVTSELWMQSDFNTSIFTSSIPHMENSMCGALLHYQTALQNLAIVMAKYNQLNLLQQDMTNMGYDREASIITEVFNQLGKSTFRNKWFVLASYLEKEYFDKEWFTMINGLVNVPSRKSNSTRDPLFTTIGIHEMPDCTIRQANASTDYWDSHNFVGRSWSYTANPTPGGLPQLVSRNTSYYEIVWDLLNMLDPHNIIRWARQVYNAGVNEVDNIARNATQYVNMISAQVDSLINIWKIFTDAYADMKVFLNVAKRAGLIKWETGMKYGIYQPKSVTSVANNINIRDVIVASCATPSRVVFNFETQKWVFYSLWDEFEGLPKFDLNNGGMDITFSVKRNLIGAEHLDTDALELCLPYLFRHVDENSVIHMTNRRGHDINITSLGLTGNEVNSNIALNRLIPKNELMGNMNDQLMNVPSVVVPEDLRQDPATISSIIRLVTHLFKIGNVVIEEGQSRTFINPSLICIVDGQMESATAEIVSMIKSAAPLTGNGA